MKIRDRQEGALSLMLVSLVFATVLFVFTLGFGVWAFTSRQDYKNNSGCNSGTARDGVANRVTKDRIFRLKETRI